MTTPLSNLQLKIASFLAADVSATSTALAVGVSDSYVSQLMEREDFLAAIAAGRTGKIEAALEFDGSLATVEEKALKMVADKLPFTKTAMEAARIFQILNGATKKVTTPVHSAIQSATSVTLVLPAAAKTSIKINNQNQVIEVDSRSMATLPSSALPSLLTTARKADAELAEARLSTLEHITLEALSVL